MTMHARPDTVPRSTGRRGPVSRLFLDRERRPRTVWRCAAYLTAWFLIIGLLSGLIGGKNPTVPQQLGYAVLVVPAVLALTYLFRRFGDRRDWRGLGLVAVRGSLPMLGVGFAVGLASMALLVTIEWSLGWLRFTGTDLTTVGLAPTVLLLGSGLVYYAATAVVEDLAFRGYLFRNTAAVLPLWASVVVVGIIFGALHLITNQLATGWFILIVPLSTVALQAFQIQTRIVTGALWLSIGWHAAWDWAESQVVNLDLPGAPGGNVPIEMHRSGPLLLTGQPGFIESGILAGLVTLLLLAGALLTWRRPWSMWATRLPDHPPDEPPDEPRHLSTDGPNSGPRAVHLSTDGPTRWS